LRKRAEMPNGMRRVEDDEDTYRLHYWDFFLLECTGVLICVWSSMMLLLPWPVPLHVTHPHMRNNTVARAATVKFQRLIRSLDSLGKTELASDKLSVMNYCTPSDQACSHM
jgi:hypothetical protein